MKHFGLKFNHGVEIGAHLAYMGHFRRTKDPQVRLIAWDEEQHRETLREILAGYDERPSPVIDFIFTQIGRTIGLLCLFAPKLLLNRVASGMEWFAVFSYRRLARLYPEHEIQLKCMAFTEERHKWYFGGIIHD